MYNNIKDQFLTISFILFIVTLPFSVLLNSISIILMIIFSITKIKEFNFKFNIFLILPIIYFLIKLIGLWYSNDLKSGYFEIEKSLVLIAMPFVFILNNNDVSKIKFQLVYNTFVGICLLVCLTSIYVYYNSFSVEPTLHNLFKSNDYINKLVFCLRYRFYIHPTYISYYLVFSISICLFILMNTKNKLIKFLNLFLAMIFMSFILMIECRIAIIMLILIFAIYFLIESKSIKIAMIYIAILSFFIISVLYYTPQIGNKFHELINAKFELPRGNDYNSTNIRIANWKCGLEIIKNNPIIGVGTGSTQNELNKCYVDFGVSKILIDDNYNCHNQYIQTWCTNGIIGLLVLLSMYLKMLQVGFSKRNIVNLAFCIILVLGSLTECLLNNQKGIVFFMFFYCVFLSKMSLIKTKLQV